MAQDNGHLISLNEMYLYESDNGAMYAPLRVDDTVGNAIKQAIKSQQPPIDSCIEKISAEWFEGKFVMTAEFKQNTKCSAGFKNPEPLVKNDICVHCLCDGKCTDKFMREVIAKNMLPEIYNTKQK